MKRQVYLDCNATTPVDPAVLEAMLPYLGDAFGNPSSIHWAGREARKAVDQAREQVAALLGADPSEIVFTSGGSEANNMALKGVAALLPPARRHIITSSVEHPSVLETCRFLERSGFQVTYVPVGRDGDLDTALYEQSLSDGPGLVSMMAANNETGVTFPLHDIGQLARERGAIVHTDAVQAVGKIPMAPENLGLDLLSLSAHKIYGPKGIGALFVRRGVTFPPLIHGGSHEMKRRAGTENVPGIVGLGKACEILLGRQDAEQERLRRLRDLLFDGITRLIPDAIFNGHPLERLPNTVNMSFPGCEGESLLLNLDLEGVAVSTGAACSSGSLKPSHVLTAMGLRKDEAQGSLRFSLGRFTTDGDIEYVLSILPAIVGRIRSLHGTGGDHLRRTGKRTSNVAG